MRLFSQSHGFSAHRSLALDFGVGKDQGPVRALLQSLLGLTHNSDEGSRRDAAERLLRQGAITEQHSVFLYDLLDLPQTGEWRALYGAMDNASRNRGKRALLATAASHFCQRGPTLLIVEDL